MSLPYRSRSLFLVNYHKRVIARIEQGARSTSKSRREGVKGYLIINYPKQENKLKCDGSSASPGRHVEVVVLTDRIGTSAG
jgi:hypothetical protein